MQSVSENSMKNTYFVEVGGLILNLDQVSLLWMKTVINILNASAPVYSLYNQGWNGLQYC